MRSPRLYRAICAILEAYAANLYTETIENELDTRTPIEWDTGDED